MTEASEIDLIRAELDALRAELADVRAAQAADAPPPIVIESAVTRRNWMKAAAAAAVGGTAVALGSSQPAAAASNFQIGSATNQDPVRTAATTKPSDKSSFADEHVVAATVGAAPAPSVITAPGSATTIGWPDAPAALNAMP